MHFKFKTILFLIIALAAFSNPSALAADEPGRIITAIVDRGLAVLRDPALQDESMRPERRKKLWDILSPVFDFEEIPKRVLGRHWRNITPQQREEFSDVFIEIIKDAFLGKSDSYQGQNIVYLRETVIKNRSKVQTKFIMSKGKEISIDFSMIKRNNQWRIYDVIIEGVSLIGNYRSQVKSILMKSSFEELMVMVYEKRNEFVAEGTK